MPKSLPGIHGDYIVTWLIYMGITDTLKIVCDSKV